MAKIVTRSIKTSFWQDAKIVDTYSPEDKYFYLYLMTNPSTTQLGVYSFVPKIASFELGYSIETVRVLLERFEKKYDVIKFSEATSEIAIKNFLRHSIIKGGKPVLDCLKTELKYVKDINLIIYIYNNLKQYNDLNNTVKEFLIYLKEYIDNKEKDNDNERYVDESSTIRSDVKEKPSFQYFEDEKVEAAFKDFVRMRNSIKKPMTSRAITRCIGKLQKLGNGNADTMVAILNQSVDHCWQDVYGLKSDPEKNNLQKWGL